jgi:hypothetical protein
MSCSKLLVVESLISSEDTPQKCVGTLTKAGGLSTDEWPIIHRPAHFCQKRVNPEQNRVERSDARQPAPAREGVSPDNLQFFGVWPARMIESDVLMRILEVGLHPIARSRFGAYGDCSKQSKPSMKIVLLFSCVIALLTAATGCLVSGGGGRGHDRGHESYERHPEVIVGPPVVEVRPPEVIVR